MGIYITRWSAKRLREIANTVKEKKRNVISKSSFGDLLHISPLPPPPVALVDFIVMRIDTKKRLLKLSDHKKIQLTRDMVKKLFNVPSGSKPLESGKRGKADFHEIYLEGERAPIPTIDMSVVHEFEWDEHILLDAMKEVKKYQDKRNEGKLKFHIGGCLPMLPVIYMDHIDIPRGCIVDHTIDYSLPRACFVKELGFSVVIAVDTIEDGFGKRPFSSTSPYATTKFMSYIEQLAQLPNKASMSATEIPDMVGADGVQQPTEGATNEANGTTWNVHEPPPKNTEGGDDVCGSLEDWLHPLPAFDELELPPHMLAIFNKHKDIHAAELKEACIDDTIEEAQVEVSSGQGHDQKHPTLKRAAPTESTAAKLPKMKKKKIDAMDDAIYQSNGLKKRAHVNNEVMSLYIESFNIEHMYSSSKPRKFAFSPLVASKLCVDPSSFNTNSCTKDLKTACEKNDIAKADQFNVFDSNIRDSDYVSILEKPCSNLDTTSLLNFRKYIAAKLFKHPQNTLSSEEELEKLLKKS
ncbi:hypothetical protein D1007_23193 [Hordeum vulgare]|nr:hypothetical protein D1007_23193 [Hordeum vulgare]